MKQLLLLRIKQHRYRLPVWTDERASLREERCVQIRTEINFLPAVSAADRSHSSPEPGGSSSSSSGGKVKSSTHRCREARNSDKTSGDERQLESGCQRLIVLWIPHLFFFFTTYAFYTTSKGFALWNYSWWIWANHSAAWWIFKQGANQSAGSAAVGVSPGVHLVEAAGRSWDEDAAPSVQLGCSDPCFIHVGPYIYIS